MDKLEILLMKNGVENAEKPSTEELLEAVEAQVLYTALMTGTLIGEVQHG